MINLAIAVEPQKHPHHHDYKVWYLEVGQQGHIQGIGVKTKKQMIENLFESYRKRGKSNWRAFLKDRECSVAVEVQDFISKNLYENTHFGNLPTLSEFQVTLDSLQANLKLKSTA